jgi:hypothetical protein
MENLLPDEDTNPENKGKDAVTDHFSDQFGQLSDYGC